MGGVARKILKRKARQLAEVALDLHVRHAAMDFVRFGLGMGFGSRFPHP